MKYIIGGRTTRIFSFLYFIYEKTEAHALLEQIEQGVYAHIGEAEQFDDITMVVIRREAEAREFSIEKWGLESAHVSRPFVHRIVYLRKIIP